MITLCSDVSIIGAKSTISLRSYVDAKPVAEASTRPLPTSAIIPINVPFLNLINNCNEKLKKSIRLS